LPSSERRRRFGTLTRLLLSIIALLGAVGCGVTYRDGTHARPVTPALKTDPPARHHGWGHFFLFGLIGRHRVDTRDACPGGTISGVHTGSNVLTVGVMLVTLGLYTPRTVSVRCAREPAP
jgi:hypothetical protein